MASGLSLSRWGPNAWGFLHATSYAYPDSPTAVEQESMRRFLVVVGEVLPCRRCREHYASFMLRHFSGRELEVLRGRASLSRFLVDMHNDVNRRTEKPTWSYEQVDAMFTEQEPLCSPSAHVHDVSHPLLIGGVVVVLLLVLIAIKVMR